MAKMVNKGANPICLPGSFESVAAGASVEVSDDAAKNETVAQWIKDDVLVSEGKKSSDKK